MNQLNSLIVEGNLVRDAVLSEPAPGFKKCLFTAALNFPQLCSCNPVQSLPQTHFTGCRELT